MRVRSFKSGDLGVGPWEGSSAGKGDCVSGALGGVGVF